MEERDRTLIRTISFPRLHLHREKRFENGSPETMAVVQGDTIIKGNKTLSDF